MQGRDVSRWCCKWTSGSVKEVILVEGGGSGKVLRGDFRSSELMLQ